MIVREIFADTFLGLATAIVLASSVGVLVMRDVYDKLHFVTPAALVAPVLVMFAVLIRARFSATTAAGGDHFFGIMCPAVQSSVISVGGTTLNLDPNGDYGSETLWSETGSGCSSMSRARSWQRADSNWAEIGCGEWRGMNDVSATPTPRPAPRCTTTTASMAGGWSVGRACRLR